MKGKTRIHQLGPIVPWGNPLFLVQVWASKRWNTLHVASTTERAAKWLDSNNTA